MLTLIVLALSTQGPVGYWRGDEAPGTGTAADSSGNGRNGTYTSGATTQSATLPPGLFHNVGTFQLDGTDDQIVIPHNTAFNIRGELTIAFWMRKTDPEPTDWTRIVGKGAGAVRTFGVWEQPNNQQRILFQQYNGSSVSVLDLTNSEDIPQTQWRHITCKIQDDSGTINAYTYVNGTLRGGPQPRPNQPGIDTQPVRIGYGEIHTYFRGQLDEVRIFDRALDDTEIRTLAGLIPAAVPMNLRTQTLGAGDVTITWDAAAGATHYVVQRSYPVPATFVTVAPNVGGLTYSESNLTWGDTYAYRVYAVGLVDSADSNVHSVTIPFPTPRTEDHDEGFLDGDCACGASARPGALAVLLALVAAALGLAIRRS